MARELGQSVTREVGAGTAIGGATVVQENESWISTTQSAA
ncbi:hypothetical protein ACVINU_003053 [Bradyrhizobium diazoefficiens]